MRDQMVHLAANQKVGIWCYSRASKCDKRDVSRSSHGEIHGQGHGGSAVVVLRVRKKDIQVFCPCDSMADTEGDIAAAYARHRKIIYIHPEGGQKLVEEYDEYAGHYNEVTNRNGYIGYKKLVDIMCHYVPCKSHNILDVASGTGLVGKELKRRGYTSIDALDPSQKSLDVSREFDAYTEYICDTLAADRQTKIPDDRYDAVLIAGAFGIPGHIDESCFPEIIRIIKPGGYFLFTIGDKVLHEFKWDNKFEGVIDAVTKAGLWELMQIHSERYCEAFNENAKIPVLKILKN